MTAPTVPEPRPPEPDPSPSYLRGHMAARVALRDCRTPTCIAQLVELGDHRLDGAHEEAELAAEHVDYWTGYTQHLTNLRQESTDEQHD